MRLGHSFFSEVSSFPSLSPPPQIRAEAHAEVEQIRGNDQQGRPKSKARQICSNKNPLEHSLKVYMYIQIVACRVHVHNNVNDAYGWLGGQEGMAEGRRGQEEV